MALDRRPRRLGHRRLSIIDLRAVADQPMADGDGRLRIVFNGEIYNYRELRAELERRGRAVRAPSPTPRCCCSSMTATAPAMVDAAARHVSPSRSGTRRERGMFLARDPFGIKPLYYRRRRPDAAASPRRSRRCWPAAASTCAPEPAGHVGFFLWGNVPEPFTLYRGVRALAGRRHDVGRSAAGAARPARSSISPRCSPRPSPAPATRRRGAALLRDALLD